jgi:hypothetical protein
MLTKAAATARTAPTTLNGVLVLRGQDGRTRAFEIAAKEGHGTANR